MWVSAVVIALLAALALSHLPFVVLDWYASADAAWHGSVATLWAHAGHLPVESGAFVEMRFRSTPLYTAWVADALAAGRLAPVDVPRVFNWMGLPAGLAIPPVFYGLLRRLVSPRAALIAVALLLSSPLFFELRWQGFPSLPAWLALLVSLLAFERALDGMRLHPGWIAAAAASLALAVLLKTDVVLLGPAYAVIAWSRTAPGARARALALALALPIGAVALWHLACETLSPAGPGTLQSLGAMEARWSLAPSGLWRRDNLVAMAMAAGMATSLAALGAAALAVRDRGLRPALGAALLCMGPTWLWWGMRELNSSRHNLWLLLPMLALLGLAIARRVPRPAAQAAVVLALALGNYFVGPTRDDFRLAPARWLESAAARRDQRLRYGRDYRLAFRQPVPRLAVAGGAGAWAVGAALAVADDAEARAIRGGREWRLRTRVDGDEREIWLLPAGARLTADELRTWTVIRPGIRGESPFLEVRADGSRAPWPARGDAP